MKKLAQPSIRKALATLFLLSVIFSVTNCSRFPGMPGEQEAQPELPFAQELQAAIEQGLSAGQGDHDLGISAAVIVPGYRPWTGVSGNSHADAPIAADMLFDAGSVAKNFEAALALKLAEEGALDLDDPLSKWLPSYPNVDSAITVRQLLDHTSGVYNVFEHPDFPWVGPDVDYTKNWPIEDVFNNFVLEPYFPPGGGQYYSSTNYLLLTAILEKASGASVPEGIERHFLKPLDLESTFFSMGEPLPGRYTAAHPWMDVDGDGKLEDLDGLPVTWKVSLTHPAIYTTPEDLARWLQALYYECSVLTPASMEEMPTFPETDAPDPGGAKYGLGVVDYSDLLGMQVIGHAGSSLGYNAAALYLPEYGVSAAWLFNTGESPPELASEIMINTWSALSEALLENLEPGK